MADPIDHKGADDATFIDQVAGQVSEMKAQFRKEGYDPYDLPPQFTIQVYPSVFMRVVDLLERAKAEGFNTRPS